MNTLYKIIDDIKEILDNEPGINTVSYGSIDDVDLTKTTIYPLAHSIPGNATIQDRVILMNFSIILMDLVDFNKKGTDNEQDVLNSLLAIAARFDAEIKRSELYRNNYELQGTIGCEPFVERFEANAAGWTMTFTVAMKNEMTSC